MPPFEFELRTTAGVVSHANHQASGLQVRVFNADFVAANLNFVGDHFNPIILLGEESKAAAEKIAQCERLLAKLDTREKAIRGADAAAVTAFGNAKTAAAAAARETMSLSAAFRADHLDREAALVRSDTAAATLGPEALQADLRMARSADQDRLPSLPALGLDIKLRPLREAAEPLLAKSPDMANTIALLVSHPDVERWVFQGLGMHEHREDCHFCGGTLAPERLADLKAHFTKDMLLHASEIATLAARVEKARLSFVPHALSALYAPFRERYEEAATALVQAIEAYKRRGVRPAGRSAGQGRFAALAGADPPDRGLAVGRRGAGHAGGQRCRGRKQQGVEQLRRV